MIYIIYILIIGLPFFRFNRFAHPPPEFLGFRCP